MRLFTRRFRRYALDHQLSTQGAPALCGARSGLHPVLFGSLCLAPFRPNIEQPCSGAVAIRDLDAMGFERVGDLQFGAGKGWPLPAFISRDRRSADAGVMR